MRNIQTDTEHSADTDTDTDSSCLTVESSDSLGDRRIIVQIRPQSRLLFNQRTKENIIPKFDAIKMTH
jgi:hypothetical protein